MFGRKKSLPDRVISCYVQVMEPRPRLSESQARRIAELAASTGLNWQDVLAQALDYNRVKTECGSGAADTIGLFADDAALVDRIVRYAYHMRDRAPLRGTDA